MRDANEHRDVSEAPRVPGRRPWAAPAIAEEEVFEAFALTCSKNNPKKGCRATTTPTNKL